MPLGLLSEMGSDVLEGNRDRDNEIQFLECSYIQKRMWVMAVQKSTIVLSTEELSRYAIFGPIFNKWTLAWSNFLETKGHVVFWGLWNINDCNDLLHQLLTPVAHLSTCVHLTVINSSYGYRNDKNYCLWWAWEHFPALVPIEFDR